VVRAALDDATVLDHQDLIRAANRREPVRNDQRGTRGHSLVERTLHRRLAFGVEVRRRFIEYYEAR
jgi:hypothetical protein